MFGKMTTEKDEEENGALRKIIDRIATKDLKESRGEDRVVLYLELNSYLRKEDTPASIKMFTDHLPHLLREFRYDLQHATMEDLKQVCLRTISYFMYHKTMSSQFTYTQISNFLSDIISLLWTTMNEATYKLCIWCLSMQNFDEEKLDLFERILEALTKAIVNPFKSRSIECQALKGIHELLIRYPIKSTALPAMAIWTKPVAMRLSSSDTKTRELSRLILEEVQHFVDQEANTDTNILSESVIECIIPAMKTCMDAGRNQEAMQLWILVLRHAHHTLAKDLSLLNELLYVPELSMRHEDTSVRLLSMEAWQHLLQVFRSGNNCEWMFRKQIIQLLIRPIRMSLEEEKSFNVLEATWSVWQKILENAVRDFNLFSDRNKKEMSTVEGVQQASRRWKHWWDEIVTQVIILVRPEQGIFSKFLNVIESIFVIDTNRPKALNNELFVIAFVLPDIFSLLHRLAIHKITFKVVWSGVCHRVLPSALVPSEEKLRMRLARICFDFILGIQTTFTPMANTENNKTHGMGAEKDVSNLLGFELQLYGFCTLAKRLPPAQHMRLFQHPKCRILTPLMEHLHGHMASPEFSTILSYFKLESLPQGTQHYGKLFTAVTVLMYVLIGFVTDGHTQDFESCNQVMKNLLSGIEVEEESVKSTIHHVVTFCRSAVQGLASLIDKSIEQKKDFLLILLENPDASSLIYSQESKPPKCSQSEDSTISTKNPTICESTCLHDPGSLATSSGLSFDTSMASPCMLTVSASTSAGPVGINGQKKSPRSVLKSPVSSTPDKTSPTELQRVGSSASSSAAISNCEVIYPDLKSCQEPISNVFRHFPIAFRSFFSFYKIKTIGDLSSMREDQVKTFGIKDPVITVMKALDEYSGRKDRLKNMSNSNSPFRKKLFQSASPAIKDISPHNRASASASATPSPNHKPSRARSYAIGSIPNIGSSPRIPPLSFESPKCKRARRSLEELNALPEFNSPEAKIPKIADRVTFKLSTPQGETRITRPGEDSQDCSSMEIASSKVPEQQSLDAEVNDKMSSYTIKLMQHLNRSAYYVDKLLSEEESLSLDTSNSETMSKLLTRTSEVSRLLQELQDAHVLVSRVSSRLQIVAQATTKRCQQVLAQHDTNKAVENTGEKES